MKDEGKFQNISTKVSTWAYVQIMKILDKKGLNKYHLLQNMCEVILRYMSDKHNRTPEMEEAMETFENMEGWKDNFNLCDPNAEPMIEEATYYIADKKGKKGVRVVHVEHPFFDKWVQTYNLQQIMERFLCLTFPSLYRRLRFIAVVKDCSSVLELLIKYVREEEREEDKRELRREFEDANRADNGKPLQYGQRTRQTKNRDKDYLEFNFNEEDNERHLESTEEGIDTDA